MYRKYVCADMIVTSTIQPACSHHHHSCPSSLSHTAVPVPVHHSQLWCGWCMHASIQGVFVEIGALRGRGRARNGPQIQSPAEITETRAQGDQPAGKRAIGRMTPKCLLIRWLEIDKDENQEISTAEAFILPPWQSERRFALPTFPSLSFVSCRSIFFLDASIVLYLTLVLLLIFSLRLTRSS